MGWRKHLESMSTKETALAAIAALPEEATLQDAADRLALLAEIERSRVARSTPDTLELEHDGLELQAELLKAASGPFTPYSPTQMRTVCAEMVQEGA
jgi:hypothetical protein